MGSWSPQHPGTGQCECGRQRRASVVACCMAGRQFSTSLSRQMVRHSSPTQVISLYQRALLLFQLPSTPRNPLAL
ncbi:hypothetical protein PSPO01_02282 [Paraphaeosphaeria sporulosa]